MSVSLLVSLSSSSVCSQRWFNLIKKKSKVRLAVITLCHRLAHIVSQTHLVCLCISKGAHRNSYSQEKKNIIISNLFGVSQNMRNRRKSVHIFLRFNKFLTPNFTGFNLCVLNILRFIIGIAKKNVKIKTPRKLPDIQYRTKS